MNSLLASLKAGIVFFWERTQEDLVSFHAMQSGAIYNADVS